MNRPTIGELFLINGREYKSTGCYETLETDRGPVAAGTYLLANRWIKARKAFAANPTRIAIENWS